MTANENQNKFSLLKQIPTVLRARGFRLYTQNGKRLVDLWLNGGAAILGHTPPNLLRELKNTASRGLYAPFPHFTESRFLKALSKLFPNRSFRLYAAPPKELAELFTSGAVKLWRPFTDAAVPFTIEKNSPPILVPVLSGIQLWRDNLPLGLCVVTAESENQLANLPVSDILSPVLLAVATRGVYDLLSAQDRAKPNFPRIAKALQTSKTWQRRGIYLYPKEKRESETWPALFNKFLDAGFLLPPTPSQPLILPGELFDGEEAKLAACLLES
ncbi:MAG: hypothetical protein LBQ93_09030 [Treponema sp.]|jgi:hypothetical protein|nr:hypothetical protein [Treponema sp.]